MARFEWAQVVAFDAFAKPPITTDEILDTPPGKLRLELQPYLNLLSLRYAVDDFLVALKKGNTDGLRGEASNAVESAPKFSPRRKRIRLPARANIHLAVHRYDNQLYFKRLEAEAFAILTGLNRGLSVESACAEAIGSSERSDVDWPSKIQVGFKTGPLWAGYLSQVNRLSAALTNCSLSARITFKRPSFSSYAYTFSGSSSSQAKASSSILSARRSSSGVWDPAAGSERLCCRRDGMLRRPAARYRVRLPPGGDFCRLHDDGGLCHRGLRSFQQHFQRP